MASFLVNRPHLSGSTFNNPSLMPISNQGLLNMDPHKQRACVHCRTTRTPLWRAGPAGPRSLCNACGIRYRKMKNNNENARVNKSGKGRKKLVGGGLLKMRVAGLGTEIVLHRSATAMADHGFPQPIGEEEQAAAMLLMALSSTYVRSSTA